MARGLSISGGGGGGSLGAEIQIAELDLVKGALPAGEGLGSPATVVGPGNDGETIIFDAAEDNGVKTGLPGSIALDVAPASDLTGTGFIASMTVDANTVGIASALHMDTDGNWIEADADTAATMPCGALALETSTGTKDVLLQGVMRNDAWSWTPGQLIFVSTTVGTLTATAPSGTGDFVQVVGVAITADVILFIPNLVMVEIA